MCLGSTHSSQNLWDAGTGTGAGDKMGWFGEAVGAWCGRGMTQGESEGSASGVVQGSRYTKRWEEQGVYQGGQRLSRSGYSRRILWISTRCLGWNLKSSW